MEEQCCHEGADGWTCHLVIARHLTASVEEWCEIHKPNYLNQSRTTTITAQANTQARSGALMAHRPACVGPGQNPQYTRAHFGGEAVGCSPTPQHTTMSPRKRATITTLWADWFSKILREKLRIPRTHSETGIRRQERESQRRISRR